jgi:hypothetical protein
MSNKYIRTNKSERVAVETKVRHENRPTQDWCLPDVVEADDLSDLCDEPFAPYFDTQVDRLETDWLKEEEWGEQEFGVMHHTELPVCVFLALCHSFVFLSTMCKFLKIEYTPEKSEITVDDLQSIVELCAKPTRSGKAGVEALKDGLLSADVERYLKSNTGQDESKPFLNYIWRRKKRLHLNQMLRGSPGDVGKTWILFGHTTSDTELRKKALNRIVDSLRKKKPVTGEGELFELLVDGVNEFERCYAVNTDKLETAEDKRFKKKQQLENRIKKVALLEKRLAALEKQTFEGNCESHAICIRIDDQGIPILYDSAMKKAKPLFKCAAEKAKPGCVNKAIKEFLMSLIGYFHIYEFSVEFNPIFKL